MKAIVVAGALFLAACTPPGVGPTDPMLAADKALYAAEASFDGAAKVAEQLAVSGVLKGKAAAATLEALDQAHTAILVAQAAKNLGDVAGMSTAIITAQTALAKANANLKTGN